MSTCRYATQQIFGGQRASVGREVTVVEGGSVYSGKIVGINGKDLPIIRVCAASQSNQDKILNAVPGLEEELIFHSCMSEQDLCGPKAPTSFWTWPPRV